MTPQEKALVTQFIGGQFGQQKANDDMIVGGSAQLKPKADGLHAVLEGVLAQPTQASGPPPQQQQQQPQHNPEQPQQPPQYAPGPPPMVTPEMAARELAAATAEANAGIVMDPSKPPQHVADQTLFDFSEPAKVDQIISLLEDIKKLLTKKK